MHIQKHICIYCLFQWKINVRRNGKVMSVCWPKSLHGKATAEWISQRNSMKKKVSAKDSHLTDKRAVRICSLKLRKCCSVPDILRTDPVEAAK